MKHKTAAAKQRSSWIAFEHKSEALLPRARFGVRMLRALGACAAVIVLSLVLGTVGYHVTEGHDWLEAALNAAMILTGMGPVDELHTGAGKVFAIVYAIFSGVVFLTSVALFLAPIVHRLLHAFHLEEER